MKKIILVVMCVVALGMSMAAGAAEPKYHEIAAGDTLSKLAGKYQTTVVDFLDFNPGATADNLRIGQKLLVPVKPLWSYHVVQPGDNASSLAKQYRVPLETLQGANGLSSNKLTVGEMIRIPIHFYLGETLAKTTHTVEIGDTLYKIAQHYKVTLAQLVKWNDIKNIDNIFAGQALIVS